MTCRNATINDASSLSYCVPGLRRWFAEKDVTFRQFCRVGVSIEWLRAQDDAMATRLADYVEEEFANGR